jgi:hypothetical protein
MSPAFQTSTLRPDLLRSNPQHSTIRSLIRICRKELKILITWSRVLCQETCSKLYKTAPSYFPFLQSSCTSSLWRSEARLMFTDQCFILSSIWNIKVERRKQIVTIKTIWKRLHSKKSLFAETNSSNPPSHWFRRLTRNRSWKLSSKERKVLVLGRL